MCFPLKQAQRSPSFGDASRDRSTSRLASTREYTEDSPLAVPTLSPASFDPPQRIASNYFESARFTAASTDILRPLASAASKSAGLICLRASGIKYLIKCGAQ